ncbi:hypothetical protein C8Q79DRAFT_926067 [Trametes meyenii]|nr:hypothetical protein C8Q79DRAFT_926067 [Trametes meyenii]
MLELPRSQLQPSSSASDDSFAVLMNAVLDSARSSGSSSQESAATTNTSTSTSTTSDASAATSASVPSLAASDHTTSTSSRSSAASAPGSASASAASSTTPSPCPSILRSSSSNLTLPSRTASPSISFAPLPTTEPRKRNSPHPLGVAARSRLLRHRRMLREHGLNPDEVPYPYGPGSGVLNDPAADAGGWPDDGPVEVREAQAGVDADEDARAASSRGGHPRSRVTSDPSEGDALLSLGRFVKGAGKSLWRSISMKDVRPKEGVTVKAGPAPASDAEVPQAEPPAAAEEWSESDHPLPGPIPRERRATLPRRMEGHLFEDPERREPSAEGGVWEESIEEESWKRLLSKPPPPNPNAKQTDGRAAASVEPVHRRPSKPTKPPKRVSTIDVFGAHIR